ncbi:MAG: transposase [Candidatus Hodarchaeaceae archaeon]|nr:transposase [Candidatus Hodarchaeaceae archaeon]
MVENASEVEDVQSVSSARFITPPLTGRKRELLGDLLGKFAESVNFYIQKCLEHKVTSRASLHHVAYEEWKSRFDLATHWFHSAGQMATQTLRSWRKLCRQGQANPEKPPAYKARTMRLELWGDRNQTGVCRFCGNVIQIRIRRGEYLWLPLVVTEHHVLRYLRDWREGKKKVGEITISLFKDRANVFVPFKCEVEPRPTEGICGIDINEQSVDLTILKPNEQPKHISLDVSKLPAIRHSSQLKRKSIQRKLDTPPQRPVQKRRLKAKYWRRERNRTNQILHVVSKQIAKIAERERVAVTFGGIKGIRGFMRSKRKSKNGRALRKDMRRRLNQWPFRKFQFYAEYKVARQGLPTVEVSNYHKSKDCPICGRYNRPNGHTYRCKACGFEASRHLVASWNIAKDGARHVPADCWQMQSPVDGLVAQAKLGMEPEKLPVQFSTGI